MSALPSASAILAVLLEGQNLLRAELAAVRGELAEMREASARRPARDEGSEALLETISYEIGDTEFSSSSLIEQANLDAAAELRAALDRFFGGRPSPKRLGKWLSKMHRRGSVGRCVVDRFHDGGHRGGIWTVRICRV